MPTRELNCRPPMLHFEWAGRAGHRGEIRQAVRLNIGLANAAHAHHEIIPSTPDVLAGHLTFLSDDVEAMRNRVRFAGTGLGMNAV